MLCAASVILWGIVVSPLLVIRANELCRLLYGFTLATLFNFLNNVTSRSLLTRFAVCFRKKLRKQNTNLTTVLPGTFRKKLRKVRLTTFFNFLKKVTY
jgi:hypothetical protein